MTNAAQAPANTQKLPRKDEEADATTTSNQERKRVQEGTGGIIKDKKKLEMNFKYRKI